METQDPYTYTRISEAIHYLTTHAKQQPDLSQVAAHVNLSPFHFQRMFTEWAGVSPKKFLQYISIQHAKSLLINGKNLFSTAFDTGLSGTGRLHDLFVHIEAMTPAEYQNGGKSLTIEYDFFETHFGMTLAAFTTKGLCYLAFIEDKYSGLQVLQKSYPYAHYIQKSNSTQKILLSILNRTQEDYSPIHLHLRGTPFQIKVWETLLKIPFGNLTTYGSIAQNLENTGASRAVGSAVGANPVAYLIPCHRVIQSSGVLGGYMWGTTRKTAIIGWEAGQLTNNSTIGNE